MIDDGASELRFDYKPVGRNGKAVVSAKIGDDAVLVDTVDLSKEAKRNAFVELLAVKLLGVDRQGLQDELTRMAGEAVTGAKCAGVATQSAELVELASAVELFHHGDTAYGTVPVAEHRETHAVRSRGFRLWLARKFHEQHGRPPAAQAMADALGVLEGRAQFDSVEHPVFVRLGEHDGSIWLDLADSAWQAVRMDANGWQVVANPPVRFLRPRGMLPMPTPVGGGSINELRSFLNLDDDDQWALVLAWLAAALRPSGPYPVLVVNGEQGCCKSTLCRLLRALVDPNKAPLRAEPKEARDLMIAASNALVLALDNISSLPPWISDAFCRLATGGGFTTRELYSDDQERVFDAMRPVLLNGIEDLAGRSDLLDRSICLTLPTMSPSKRRTEADLWAAFEVARPALLGALLSAVSAGLRNLPNVRLDNLPRMADFATWVVACEPTLGLPRGAFLDAYQNVRESANTLALESVAVGPLVVGLLRDRPSWTGTARELLAEFNTDRHSNDQVRRQADWPRTPRKLAGDLRRLAPNLRAMGIEITFLKVGHAKQRTIVMKQSAAEPSASSAPSVSFTDAAGNAIHAVHFAEGALPSELPYRPRSSAKSRVVGPQTLGGDDADGADGVSAIPSAGPCEVEVP